MQANDEKLKSLIYQFINITIGEIFPVEVYRNSVGWEDKSKFPWFVSYDGDDKTLEVNDTLIKMITNMFGLENSKFVDDRIIDWFNKNQNRTKLDTKETWIYNFSVSD